MGGGFEALLVVVVVAAAALLQLARAATDAADVSAINGFYVALGSPVLPGWTANGGDPCGEDWQGVVCAGSHIDSITMNAANLGGQLGSLGSFTSIIKIDLSNNKIGGAIPEDLPVTLQNFFLSANQLTGSIPSSLSKLRNLTAMSLNGNHLDGELPDVFGSLTRLVNLDISSNSLSGPLPPSFGNMSSLTTLRAQDNQLSGTLNVLEDLPLKDLNIENNLFSGPVPEKLLNIPNFKKDGNPFNTSIAPSASPASAPPGPTPTPTPTPTGPTPMPTPKPTPTPRPRSTPSSPLPPSRVPPPSQTPSNSSGGSTARDSSPPSSRKHNSATLKIVGYVLLAVVIFIVTVLLVIFCLSKYQERQSRHDYTRSQAARVHQRVEEPKISQSSVLSRNGVKKGSGDVLDRRQGNKLKLPVAAAPEKPHKKQREHVINLERTESDLFPVLPPPPPPPPPRPLSPVENVIVKPLVSLQKRASPPPRTSPLSATSFSVGSLQQYTRSFREENLIRESRLGKVYLAEFPEGKSMEVMTMDNANGRIAVDDFLELVRHISEMRHHNILELVGYCAEYGQRLLVYSHFSRKTLHDALHGGDVIDDRLSWSARLQVALGAGRALEYLHESCEPSVVHQNFEAANVLLDNEFSIRVAECGLAKLMSSSSVTQLSGRMHALLNYEAPEIHESGIVTYRSDVYSFGVVMLELLTGRKPYESSRPRAEQHLVRWASSQLHDIESLSKMVDPSIRRQCSEKALSRFADIISRCIQREPGFRPLMSEVVQDLARVVNATGEESE